MIILKAWATVVSVKSCFFHLSEQKQVLWQKANILIYAENLYSSEILLVESSQLHGLVTHKRLAAANN